MSTPTNKQEEERRPGGVISPLVDGAGKVLSSSSSPLAARDDYDYDGGVVMQQGYLDDNNRPPGGIGTTTTTTTAAAAVSTALLQAELERCKQELAKEKDQKEQLSHQLKEATKELDVVKEELEEEVNALLQEKKLLLLQVESLNAELDGTEVEVDRLKKASNSLSQGSGSLNDSVQILRAELSSKTQQHEIQLRGLHTSYDKAMGRARQLEQQVDMLEGQVKEYQQKLIQAEQEQSRVVAAYHGGRRRRVGDDDRRDLEAKIEGLESALEGLQTSTRLQLDATEMERIKMSRRLEASQAEAHSTISHLEHELTIKDEAMTRMGVELKEERDKSLCLAKDKTRLSVECESMTRKLNSTMAEVERLEEELRSSKSQVQEQARQGRQLSRDVRESGELQTVLAGKLEALQQQLGLADSGRITLKRENDTLKRQINEVKEERESMLFKLTHLTRDHDTLQEEKKALETTLRAAEEESIITRQQRRAEKEDIIRLCEELEQAKEIADEHRRSQGRCTSLQLEVKEAVQRCIDLDKALTIKDQEIEEARFLQRSDGMELQSLRLKYENLIKDNASLKEQARREASITIARQAAVDAAEERTQAAITSKRVVESQLEDLQAGYVKSLSDKRQIEEEMIMLQAQLSISQEEANALRAQASRTREAVKEAEKAQQLALEVESLRKQLAVTRAAMVEGARNPDEGKGDMERLKAETQRQKKVYEGVVNSIRRELAEETQQRADLQQKTHQLQSEAEKAHQLEEEVEYLKLKVQRAQEDFQVVESKASQSRREVVVLTQERDAAAREALKAKETAVSQAKEIEHLREALGRERRRAETLAEEVGHKEIKANEFFAAASRAEMALETIREESKKQEFNLLYSNQTATVSSDKLGKLQQDYLALMDDHEALQAESDRLRVRLEEVSKAHREQGGVQVAVQRDLSTTKVVARENNQRADMLKRALAEKEHQCQALQDEVNKLKEDMELSKLVDVRDESSKASQQLQDLRLELDRTVAEWDKAEKARRVREESVTKLKTSLQAQLEKNALLHTQMKLLEEQIKFLNEELSVYRQLEVYNTTLEHEFRSLRRRRNKPSPDRRTTNRSRDVNQARQDEELHDQRRGFGREREGAPKAQRYPGLREDSKGGLDAIGARQMGSSRVVLANGSDDEANDCMASASVSSLTYNGRALDGVGLDAESQGTSSPSLTGK